MMMRQHTDTHNAFKHTICTMPALLLVRDQSRGGGEGKLKVAYDRNSCDKQTQNAALVSQAQLSMTGSTVKQP